MWSEILNHFNPDQAAKEYVDAKYKYAVKLPWYKKILGYCPWCKRYFRYEVKTERRNSAYVDEASNWITACKSCRELDEEYFASLWEDYYGGLL